MEYKIEIKSWGRVFTVPCSVVDEHLKNTDGDFLKVLLCVISWSGEKMSSEKISDMTGVSQICVDKAIDYWNSCGVITACAQNDFVGFTPEIKKTVSVKSEGIGISSAETDRTGNNYYSPSQVAKILNSSEELKSFFNEVQAVLGRILTNADQRGFIYIYEELGFSPASILLLTEYCKDIGRCSIAYIKSVAKSWFEQDIVAYGDIEKHIIKLNEYHSYENKISSVLGITIKLTTKQKEYINNWKSMGISCELAELAYEKCVDATSKLSFAYINKILENWHSAGIKTVEQAKNESKQGKKNNQKKEHSYNIDEIDDFQKNFLLNRKKIKN